MTEITLRPLQESDVRLLSTWHQDPVLCAHAGWSSGSSQAGVEQWWRDHIASPDDRLTRLLAMDGTSAIGYTDLYADIGQWEPGQLAIGQLAIGLQTPAAYELGYIVAPSSRWGRGLGTLLARAALDHCFAAPGCDRIWAEALAANVASVRVLEKIGMRYTGLGNAGNFLGKSSRYLQYEIDRPVYGQTSSVAT